MDYIADESVDITVSKSMLLTFLGNEFGNLLTSFCVDKRIGTVFHRTKADMKNLLSYSLHNSSMCSSNAPPVDVGFLNRRVHEVINYQRSKCSDQSMKLAFDIDGFVGIVHSLAPELWDHSHSPSMSAEDYLLLLMIQHFLDASNVSVGPT